MLTKYYEVKNILSRRTRWTRYIGGLSNTIQGTPSEENAEYLSGRTVNINRDFTMQGTPDDYDAEIQFRCHRQAAATECENTSKQYSPVECVAPKAKPVVELSFDEIMDRR